MKKLCTVSAQALVLMSAVALEGAKPKLSDEKSHIQSIKDQEAVLQKKDLITNPLSVGEKKAWNSMMAEIKNYVAKNAPKLMPHYDKLAAFSQKIFSGLENNYNKNVKGKKSLNKKAIADFLFANLPAKEDLEMERKNVGSAGGIGPKVAKARSVLYELAVVIWRIGGEKVWDDLGSIQ